MDKNLLHKIIKKQNIHLKKIDYNTIDNNSEYLIQASVKRANGNILCLFIYSISKVDNPLIYVCFYHKTSCKYLVYNIISKKWGEKLFLEQDCKKYFISKSNLNIITKYTDSGSLNIFKSLSDIEEACIYEQQFQEGLTKVGNLKKIISNKLRQWVDNIILPKRYIFYDSKRSGICPYCKNKITILKGHKHNHEYQCTNCSKTVTLKALGYLKGDFKEYESFCYLQKINYSCFIMRYFSVIKVYDKSNTLYPELNIVEYERAVFGNKYLEYRIFRKYFDGKFYQSYGKEINSIGWGYGLRSIRTCVYPYNLTNTIKNSCWKYSGIDVFTLRNQTYKFIPYTYLNSYRKYPVLEYLSKLNLTNILTELLSTGYYNNIYRIKQLLFRNPNESLNEALLMKKPHLKLFSNMNIRLDELYIYKTVFETTGKLLSESEIKEYNSLFGSEIKSVLKYSKVYSLRKIANYFLKEANNSNLRPEDIFTDWKPYIKWCQELGYELSRYILFPPNFYKHHDRVSNELEEFNKREEKNKIRRNNRRLKSLYPKLKELYSYEDDKFCIIPPKTSNDLKKEGTQLNNCIASYIDSVAKGDTVILFIRKKEKINISYYAIRIVNGEIMECRTKGQKSYTDEKDHSLINFVNKYKKEVLYKVKLSNQKKAS